MGLSIGAFVRLKNRKAGLDRPLKVGGGIQPRLVTVLTPATTFTVGEDFIQNGRAVNSAGVIIYRFYSRFEPCRSVRSRTLLGYLLTSSKIACVAAFNATRDSTNLVNP